MGFEPMNGFNTVNRLAGGPNRPLWHLPKKPTLLPGKVYTLLVKRKAEGEGFEPSVGCCLLRFSRPSQSSTLPSLQAVEGVISTRSRSITRRFLRVKIMPILATAVSPPTLIFPPLDCTTIAYPLSFAQHYKNEAVNEQFGQFQRFFCHPGW